MDVWGMWRCQRVMWPALLLAAVTACGGGGGGSDDTAFTGAVSGTASKGPLRGATVNVSQLDGAGFAVSPVPPASPTGADGNFNTTSSVDPLLLETCGGSFLDESDPAASKRQISFTTSPCQGLLGILPANTSSVAITPITTALVLKSRREAAGANFQAVFDNNRALAQQAFGFDVVTTLPTDPTNPTGTTAQKQYAMVLGGVAQVINNAAVQLGMVAPNYDLIRAVMEDLSDGRLNGQVNGSPVQVGGGPMVLPQPPNNIKLNAEINRFRNNNAAHYSGVPLVVVDENTWSQSGVPPGACVAPPPNMVAWWPGDGHANDIQATNHGTLQNGATFAAGMVGQAFSFNGDGAYVEVPDDTSLDFGSGEAFSFDMWLYRTSDAGNQHVFGKRTACGPNDYNYQMPVDYARMPLNTWVHVAHTFDGTTYRAYIDGQLISEVGGGGGSNVGPANNASLRIGTSGSCPSFDGLIDEVEIFNRTLSATEIQAIYNAGSAGKCKPRPANDDFADAITTPSAVPFTINVDTTGATAEAGEPQPCGGIGATVWYNWSPNFSGTAIINTLGSTHPDPVLAAYTGNSLATLVTQACDDDALYNVQVLQSQISFAVAAGTTYRIQAGGFVGQTGSLTINFDRDSDDDFVGDAREATLGTNPNNPDSDGDGLSDGNEVNDYGTDPLDLDTDGDGLSDGYEVNHGSDPLAFNTCLPQPVGMVAWYSGDNHADDLKGFNNGTLINGATFANGFVSKAFSFDGVDDVVEVAVLSGFTPAQLTIDAWVRADALTNADGQGAMVIVTKRRNSNFGSFESYRFGKTVTDRWTFRTLTGVNDSHVATSTSPVVVGEWVHLAGTYDGANLRLFVNGVLEATTPAPALEHDATQPVFIGGNGPDGGDANFPYQFAGMIDEVEIFNRALDPDEIQAIYGIGSGGKCKDCQDVAATNDLWEHTNHASTTGSATLACCGGSDIRNMFGFSFGVEPANLLFQDFQPDGFAHFAEWTLLSPVTVSSFRLKAHMSPDNPVPPFSNSRSFREFRLYGCSGGGGCTPVLLYSSPVVLPYGGGAANNRLVRCVNIQPFSGDHFKAEFIQQNSGSNTGPRVEELDGFGPLF